jgi:dinuclear metal center YbgI/SA1388 family protein
MKLRQIFEILENRFPLSFQESYDNSGLIVGNPNNESEKALVCIDVTDKVIDEAIEHHCDLIISHHPFIFGGLQKINLSNPTGKIIEKAIKNNITIYAAHTNLDNTSGGVNSILCAKLGLVNTEFLKPKKGVLRKLVTFCPEGHSEKVREAMFSAGAGNIGNYSSCSFNAQGQGTFFASENTNPFVGEINKLHYENETRIETVFPAYLEQKVVAAMLKNHPYEEVAYDIFTLENSFSKAGEGMTGFLEKELSTENFLQFVKSTLSADRIRYSGIPSKQIKKVAVCGGAGSSLINDAIRSGADAFITSDIKYHQFFEGSGKFLLIDAGHYETEQFAKEIIHDFLIKNFPKFAIRISLINTNPVIYF